MIRKAGIHDCANLAALSLQVWLDTYATEGIRPEISHYVLTTFNESYFVELLKKASIDIRLFEQDSHLVGFIVVDLESRFEKRTDAGYEVVTLYVSPHFHRQGIGRKLLEEIEHVYGRPFWLSTWVENYDAIDFYHRLGFRNIGEINFNLDGELHKNHVFSLPCAE